MQTGTITAKPRAFFSAAQADKTFRGHTIDHQSDGTAIVRDVKVFKAGTFRDSWGDQHTWTAEHLAQMVDNFTLLKAKEIFPDPPVRADHSMSIDKVKGYFESTRSDGVFLYGDLHITEPDAVTKVVSGSYRNVSLEVGMYVANDESAYWPVIYGVAYVDIPAVEGLHSKNAQVSHFSQTEEKEAQVGTENSQTDPLIPTGNPASATSNHAAATPPAPAPAVFKFRVNGAETIDFGAVQAHISTLEGFRDEVNKSSRTDFVKGLAGANKITTAQVEGLEEFAIGLSPEQFVQWSKAYETTPALPILEKHGKSQTTQSEPENADADAREVLEGQIEMFTRAGKPQAWIDNTTAAKALAALNAKS